MCCSFIKVSNMKFERTITWHIYTKIKHMSRVVIGIKRDGANSEAQFNNRDAGIPSGPAAEFDESSLMESIMRDSVIIILVRNTSSSWDVIDSTEKNDSGSVTCLFGRGVVQTLLNCSSKSVHISNLSDVNKLISFSFYHKEDQYHWHTH